MISLHIPLTKESHHLIDDTAIKRMKDDVVLVNTARGAIVDESAIVKNIKKFKAVCMDVLEDEKNFNKTHPLLAYPNVIITHHSAFYTYDAIARIGHQTIEIIKRFKDGDRTGRVVYV